MEFSRKIENELFFSHKFTFCTLVTNYDEYEEMVNSAKNVGFDGLDVEYFYFDNKVNNKYDGYSGINRAIRESNGEYLIFCHQDIVFHDDNRKQLEKCLNDLEIKDPKWAVAGNAGKQNYGKGKARISDPNGANLNIGDFPELVISVDENFMIINRKHSISCSSNLSGFHFYGLDLCQNAKDLGLNTYVIDFHLLHKSAGNLDDSFYYSKNEYIKMICNRKSAQIIWTTCTQFYVSSSKILNWLFNLEYLFIKKNNFDKRLERYRKKFNKYMGLRGRDFK